MWKTSTNISNSIFYPLKTWVENSNGNWCKCQSQIVHLLESQNVQLLELIIASFFRFQHVYLTF